MPLDERMRVQTELILHSLDDAAASPPPDRWEKVNDIDYLYREYVILTRERDADRVEHAITQILGAAGYAAAVQGQGRRISRERVSAGVVQLMIPRGPLPVPALLDRLDEDLGPGVATPDHIVFVCPYSCPIPEPRPRPPGTPPVPPPSGSTAEFMRERPVTGREGEGVSVVVVDTGLTAGAADGHPWLDGVQGAPEDTFIKFDGKDVIAPYAGHGTFVAGVARCVAPRATVQVVNAFPVAGATYEASLLDSLEQALVLNPDIFIWPFTASTRRDLPPLTFDDLFERRTRYQKSLVMLAAAGNDRAQRPMWPAAHPAVTSVGALAVDGRERAFFSNYGKWVDVYAPGQDLVNAFPVGTYVYHEPPDAGKTAQFEGMAVWGGTSFAVPIVAGLIAARMSVTEENARQAADSLLRFALGQAIPGVGAVLYPGQAVFGRPGAPG
jgi:subtilisin family serine protease